VSGKSGAASESRFGESGKPGYATIVEKDEASDSEDYDDDFSDGEA
jgi:hypothetical protein